MTTPAELEQELRDLRAEIEKRLSVVRSGGPDELGISNSCYIEIFSRLRGMEIDVCGALDAIQAERQGG